MNILLYVVVIFLAALPWTLMVGAAGLPGSFYTHAIRKRESKEGALLVLLGYTYASLVFVAFVVGSARSLLAGAATIPVLIGWLVAWWLATRPIAWPFKDVARSLRDPERYAEPDGLNVRAMPIAWYLTHAGFLTFAFFPSAMNFGWNWVPHF